MYIQDVVALADLGEELLSFYRAIGVDMIQLELRGGLSQSGSVAQDLHEGRDCTAILEQARE